jgi:hypothetical protein
MRKRILALTACALMVTSAICARAQEFKVTLEEDTTAKETPVYLYLSFYGIQNVDAPKIPEISGLRIRYVGPSTKVSVVNGKVSRSETHTYLIMPLRSGTFKIGPFDIEHNGRTFSAEAVTLNVRGPASYRAGPSSGPAVTVPGARSPGDTAGAYTSDDVFLRMELPEREVYVNEKLSLKIKLYVRDRGLKDISFPSYPHEGFSVGEVGEPERKKENYRGRRYDVLVFEQDIFGVKPGTYELGPASVSCKMMVREQRPRRSTLFGRSVFDDDFFSSRIGFTSYPIDLESNAISARILPFPREGRPDTFRGAVGDFTMDAGINTARVKAGDPVVLKMTIKGMGNLDTVTAPRIDPGEDYKTYEPQVSKSENRKVYEQIFIPRSADTGPIPEVRFSFFDPRRKEYRTVTRGPFPVEVMQRPGSEQRVKMVTATGETGTPAAEDTGKDIVHIKYEPGKLYPRQHLLHEKELLLSVLFIVPGLMFAAFYVSHRRKERIMTDRSYARSLRAPRKASRGLARAKKLLDREDRSGFYDAVFMTLQDYLGDRFDLPRGSVTVREVENRMGDKRNEEFISMLRDVFSRCEMARYASSAMKEEDESRVFEEIKKLIDHFERTK